MTRLWWAAAAVLATGAAVLAVQHPTPVDRALPLIALAVTLVAAVSYSSVMTAVPLLVAAELVIADENLRLLALGAIVAAAFGAGLTALAPRTGEETGVGRGLVVAAAAIVLLRWIPADGLMIGRELLLLALSLFLVVVLDGTPLAVAAATVTALATPAIPLRTFAFPLSVVLLSIVLRAFGLPRLSWTWPASAAVAGVMLFFPWSGVLARGFPYFLMRTAPAKIGQRIADALPPGTSVTYRVPDGATSVVVSGANVARLRRGEPLGTIEPGGISISIGDASDWGFMRRDQIAASRNPLPRDPAGTIRGYGYDAWVDGAGRIALPANERTIRITASPTLPPGAMLQVEGFESGGR